MNILVIGSGAREHAISLAFKRSKHPLQLYCYGNTLNPGIQQLVAGYVQGDICDVIAITKQAQNWQIDLAFIGPEAPLEQGVTDALQAIGIVVIGPTKRLAQIETSKGFARDLMSKYTIAGAPRYQSFTNMQGIAEFLAELGENYVVKADGLMGGKGVKVAGDHLHSHQEALQFCQEILRDKASVLIEEKLIGQEFSLMCFCDGKNIVSMPIVQDHKRAYVDDKGPNTGGMGSYSDADHSLPFLTHADVAAAQAINQHVIEALTAEIGEKYIGILYGSFIATQNDVQVIEFNARFGDPESLNVLTILQSDFLDLCLAMTNGTLAEEKVVFAPLATVCKYVVPKGYPDAAIKGEAVDISAVKDKKFLYLGSVDDISGQLIAAGSRTAAYVGVAATITAAEKIAEEAVSSIEGPLFHREDIGTEKLIKQRIDHMRLLRQL